ncbi:hypothetical protein HUU39_02695 [candidate division KSB1 bacterium]|nr:hypothetical protein [bacterium]NUM64173.1 hypothetical protein [candidate division KSB1 bacterium]
MIARIPFHFVAAVAILIGLAGCERDVNTLTPASYPTNAEIFLDGIAAGLDYQAFSNSKLNALQIDATEKYQGSRSLQITVPSEGDPSGWFAGGAFVATTPRDLSGYDALTFWAKASVSAPLGLVGFGNDNTGTSRFVTSWSKFTLTTTWQKYIIPIPLAEKLKQERGLFEYSAGAFEKAGYYIWFDEVKFEHLGTIAHPRPAITTKTFTAKVGDTQNVAGTAVTFNIAGTDQTVDATPSYFTFISSDPAVATVSDEGVISAVGVGNATITAKLGAVDATGAVTVNVKEAQPGPAVPAPTPTLPAGDVISLYSNAYTNVAVDTWSADWDQAEVAEVKISGNDTRLYTNLTFAGIEFTSQTINASAMTRFHMDIWTPDPTAAPAAFRIKLVDFGADGVFGGGNDAEHELTFTQASTPPLTTGNWVSFDIPLANFTGLTTKGHLAQLIISGDPKTVYVDNVYFHKTAGPTGPTAPAPTPTVPAGDVVSLFSNAYTNVNVDTWSAPWDQAELAEVKISGNDTKLYTNLTFAGIECTSQPINAEAMTRFHLDLWTPDATAAPAAFRIKLVDFGADGAFGGGNDVEHELTFTQTSTPPLATGNWVSFDIPLADFTGLTTKGHLAQLIISGDLKTVYIDNVYFYKTGGATTPTAPAPTPAFPASDVISLFSNAYTNVTVDTWSAPWDQADVADEKISGNDTKLYTNVTFAGIEFTSQPINASAMTRFHLDLWTPDATAAPAAFRIKLVDFGADGAFGGGNDVEHELTFTQTSTPPLATGNWVSFDIPLADFTGLVTKGHLAQLIISGDLKTVYVDNVLLRK